MRKGLKLMLIIIGAIIVLIILAALIQGYTMEKNKVDHGSNPVTYAGGEKSAVVLYQPAVKAKAVDNVAKLVAQQLNNDGYTVTVDYVGSHVSKDLSEYDVVVFGSPTYMRNISPVAMSTIENITNYGDNPNVNFFAVGMLKNTPELDDIKEVINDNLNSCIKFYGADSKMEENVTTWVKSFD